MALGTLTITAWLSSYADSCCLCVYFLVSVLGGILFLLSALETFFSSFLLQCAITLKLGLAPFHFWVFNLLRFLPLPSLCIFLGPAKAGLLWVLVSSHSISLPFASLSLLLGIIWLWLSFSFSLILYSSRSCQFLIFFLLGPSYVIVFYLLYCLALLAVLCISFEIISPFLAFLCLAGLPPLTMFSAKLLALSILSFASGLLLVLISVLSFLPYLTFSLSLRSISASRPLLVCLLIVLPLIVVYLFQ